MLNGMGSVEVAADRVEGFEIDPTRGMLLIECEPPKERTKGGIIMPNVTENEQMWCTAKVLRVGEARQYRTVDDTLPTVEVSEGERILHVWVCPSLKFEQEGRKLALLDQDDVKGVLRPKVSEE